MKRNAAYSFINFSRSGALTIIEGPESIPFQIKRIYFMSGMQKDEVRGKDAHMKLQKIISCPVGACDCVLDNGFFRETIRLNAPNKGLYIKGGVWQEFTNFTPDCLLMVLASLPYDQSDSIKDYNLFKQLLAAKTI